MELVIKMPCKRLKGILVLFKAEQSYSSDMSRFYNPKVQKVSVIIEGNPNQLYTLKECDCLSNTVRPAILHQREAEGQ